MFAFFQACTVLCATLQDPVARSVPAAPVELRPWSSEVVLTVPTKLGGLALGDLLPAAGNEVAAVAGDGSVHVAWLTTDAQNQRVWRSLEVARFAGEMIQVAAGNVDGRPGAELVVVGMEHGTENDTGRGAAYLITRLADQWQAELAFVDAALLHGACIAELDPRSPGPEILLVGFSLRATLLSRSKTGWQARTIAELPGPGKNAIAWAGGAVVACADGTLVFLELSEEGWNGTALQRAPAGQARLGSDGERLAVARDDGALVLFESPTAEPETLWRSAVALRGASWIGADVATGGYDHAVALVSRDANGAWHSRTLFEDEAPLHHVIAGELGTAGPAIFACGYAGRLIALQPPRPTAPAEAPK